MPNIAQDRRAPDRTTVTTTRPVVLQLDEARLMLSRSAGRRLTLTETLARIVADWLAGHRDGRAAASG